MNSKPAEAEARSAADFLFSLMEQAWNVADVDAYAQLFSDHTGYVNRYGAVFQSRAEVARIHAEAFAGRFKGTRLHLSTRRFRLLEPAVAVAHVDVVTSSSGSDSRELRAIATVVLHKHENDWQIAALHVSEVQPSQ